MKVRLDSVKKSSFCSFIGVFARIADMEKARKIIERYNLMVVMGKHVLREMAEPHFNGYGANWAGIALTPDKNEICENDNYLLWESIGEADNDDNNAWDDDAEEYYYNIGICDFESKEQEIYNALATENGFELMYYGYGAGRSSLYNKQK